MNVAVKIKKLDPNAIVPTYAHDTDACFDLCALTNGEIFPGDRKLIKTGIAVELPEGYEIQVRPRSGLAYKQGITVLNAPGTVDEGYRFDVGVILMNAGDRTFEFNAGDRIAQACVKPVYHAVFELVDELSMTERGEGGFGSTGTKSLN